MDLRVQVLYIRILETKKAFTETKKRYCDRSEAISLLLPCTVRNRKTECILSIVSLLCQTIGRVTNEIKWYLKITE